MRQPQALPSKINLPVSQWAGALREAALTEPPAHDTNAVLAAFSRHSDFYRRRLQAVKDWAAVAPLEKNQLRDVPVSDDGTLKEVRTSGTTGQQVSIWNTSREREFRRALLYRPQLFYPLPAQVRQLVFVDGDWCMQAADWPKQFSYGGVEYQTWFAGAAGDIDAIRELLESVRPQLIRGITSALVRLLMESGQGYRKLGVSIVAPGGEFLLPEWRALIEDGFNAPLLDRYGSQETGAIAWQCPYCNLYHANADEILLEPEPDGLIATPLFISSQPLLRYRLGDQVQIDASAGDCQVRLPILKIAAARRDDWLTDGEGRRVSPLGFQFEQIDGLQAWRVYQSEDGSLTLYFDAQQPEVVRPALAAALCRLVPGRPLQTVEGVWQLKRGGKFKRIVSDCRQD